MDKKYKVILQRGNDVVKFYHDYMPLRDVLTLATKYGCKQGAAKYDLYFTGNGYSMICFGVA